MITIIQHWTLNVKNERVSLIWKVREKFSWSRNERLSQWTAKSLSQPHDIFETKFHTHDKKDHLSFQSINEDACEKMGNCYGIFIKFLL